MIGNRHSTSFGALIGTGTRAVSKYTGTVLAVFVVQTLVAGACTLAIAAVLAQVFSKYPMFDEAVDGSLVALIQCLTFGKQTFLAIGCVMFGAIALWQLACWFLVGGLYGVLAQRPEGRGDTARCFGASGATTYLKYARLALCSIPGWVFVLFAFGFGTSMVTSKLELKLTVGEALGPLVLASLPALLLLHFFWTVSDYARVELTLRNDTHDPGVFFTYWSSLGYVLRRPITLLHGGFGWLVFLLVTVAYSYLSAGHPMYGAEGAVTLFFVRQGVALLRHAVRIGILGGQIELGRTRPLPARRVEVKVDTKA